MAGPLNPNAGRPIYPYNPEIVPPASAPITAEDLPELSPHYTGIIEHLENEADIALQSELGENYTEDPFIIPISRLSGGRKAEFGARLDEATGARSLIDEGFGPRMSHQYIDSRTGRPARSPAGRFVFDSSAFSDPRVLRMSQQTMRYEQSRSMLMAERYFSSGTHIRQRVLNNIQRQIDNHISTEVVEEGKRRRQGKILVFDVETPGLKPEEGIWQISARMMHPDGRTEDLTRTFDNPRMRWGGEMGQNRQSLQDFLNPNGVTDFETGMRDFMNMANQADFVAGHNIFFDYRMLHHGLTNTPAYKNDTEFRNMADTFMGKFYNPSTKEIGNVIDTLQLSRAYLHQIPVAEELMAKDSIQQYSMQNILLQTNLLERVKGEIGQEAVTDLLGRGTHFADVDVPLESYLLKYLQEGAQGGAGLTYDASNLTAAERKMIAESGATTPNLPISSVENLHPLVAEKARQAGILEEGNTHITPMENMVVASRDLTGEFHNPSTPNAARNLLSMFQVDNGNENIISMANNAGMWNRMFGGNVTQRGTLRNAAAPPDAATWRAMQAEMHQANIPMSGMSWMERHLSSTLAQAGGGNASEKTMRGIFGADVNPMARFYGSDEVDVVGRSQITKVPVSMLEEWEQQWHGPAPSPTSFTQAGENPQMLYGSFFNVGGHSEMSLVAQIEDDQKQNLLDFLTSHPSIAGDEELKAKLANSFAANTGTYGVQVGTLTNLQGGMGVENVRNAFSQVMGVGADYSDQTPMIALPYAGREGDTIHTMGTIVRPDLLSNEEKAVVARSTAAGMERQRQLESIMNTPMMGVLAEQMRSGSTDMGAARKMVRAYGAFRKNAPLIGIAAAVGGTSYYEHRKHKEQDRLNEVMAMQPTTPNPNPNYGLVQQLNDNKIGHTLMGASKYQYLFGTGYQ